MKHPFLTLLTVAICTPVFAQQPKAVVFEIDVDANGPIQACAKKENGQLRVVESPEDCLPSEFALSWNDPEPTPPTKCREKKMQFVGFSTKLMRGGDGVLHMTLACQETFANSRACDSEEIAETINLPDDVSVPVSEPAPYAWVRPSAIVGRGASIGIETTVGLQSDVEKFTCAGWNNSTSTALAGADGLTVNRHGQFVLTSCASSLKVACCAVVEDADD